MNPRFLISRRWTLYILAFVCFCITASVVGGRGEDVGNDTGNYILLFQKTLACECIVDTVEPLFGAMTRFLAYISNSETLFLSTISILQLISALWLATVLHRLLGFSHYDIRFICLFLALLLISPFFKAGQVNVIRQGLSVLFVILAILALTEKKWLASTILSVIGVGLHYSALLYLCAIPLLLISATHRRLVFIILTFLYAAGFTQYLVQVISDSLGLPIYAFVSDYGEASDYVRGVRLDFLAFSLLPIVLFRFINPLIRGTATSDRFQYISNIYVTLLVPFLIFGWGAFSDRFAYGAWLLMPAFLAVFLIRLLSPKSFIFPLAIFVLATIYFIGSLNASI